MKFLKVWLAALSFALISFHTVAQKSNYVVIGAFRVLNNAVRFTAAANKNNFTAQFAIQPERKLYYVYILGTDDRKKAFNLLIKIKVETEYRDAWVYIGKLGEEEIVKKEVKTEPVTPPVVEPVKEPVVEPPPLKDSVKVEPPKVDSTLLKKPKPEAKKPKGRPFYFKVVNKQDGKELFGNLQLQEAVGASQYQAIKSGEIVYLEAPVNKKGAYSLLAQLPGYQQSKLVFVYDNSAVEKGSQSENIITLVVDKAKRGDYIDFNNVHFFKNSSVLKPESQDELGGLVNLLKENTRYKIKIYGHCNGKQVRESYTIGTSTNFFAMDPKTNKKETISSKELSLARAETLKAYLVQQGIEAGRIGTKGEGGKIPLYPEGGALGEYNDRVEVEFVKN
ncbi:MAG TPA: OmpA family protein [Cyclobacteriaceae bacterium]|nr:OmpA family protein [Cyclobacteriaceae bacterium]